MLCNWKIHTKHKSILNGRIARAAIWCVIFGFNFSLPTPTSGSEIHQNSALDQILEKYTFIGDFHKKPPMRAMTDKEMFWRYPIRIPDQVFKYNHFLEDMMDDSELIPVTEGEGRATQHLNRGRMLFLNGDYEKARSTWLAAKQAYGTSYPHHRRCDYFIALSFLKKAEKTTDEHGLVTVYNNATTFLSYAFQVKRNIPDPVLDQRTPHYLYDLAAIYYNFGRFGGAFSVANEALQWLREKGLATHRIKFKRILAESFVKNRTYLNAVQEFDIALRQDKISHADAAAIFARVGDIYFDLNNFELAEDIYRLAIEVDREQGYVRRAQYVLRGESLFWLGRYSDAQKMFHYALNSAGDGVSKLPAKLAAVASIRMADSWLVQVDREKIKEARQALEDLEQKFRYTPRGTEEKSRIGTKLGALRKKLAEIEKPLVKAKVNYSRHIRSFPYDHTADHARIRLACLGLPRYQGQNINHARKLLDELKRGIRKNELALTPVPDDLPESEEKSVGDGVAAKDNAMAAPLGPKRVPLEDHIPPLPTQAVHLAWGCEIASYAKHDRNQEMVDRVRKFASAYPRSSFISELVEPVRETQAKKLSAYIEQGDIYSAAVFFQQNRKLLFKKISKPLSDTLFEIFVDVYKSNLAEEFYAGYVKRELNDMQKLRVTTFSAERYDINPQRGKVWAKKLEASGLDVGNNNEVRSYLDRIMNSPGVELNYHWILNLAGKWAKADSKIACEISYPILSKLWAKSNKGSAEYIQKVQHKVNAIMKTYLNELIQFETFCGYSLMELEQKIYQDNPLKLYNLYMARSFLPINPVTGNLFWSISEKLWNTGFESEAEQIWLKLRDSGEKGVKEVAFAKSRLDKSKTELENLWD